MTALGPAVILLVRDALDRAGVGPDLEPAVVANITGHALDVIALDEGRDEAIDALVYRWDLARPFVTKALDLAVEAITATPQE